MGPTVRGGGRGEPEEVHLGGLIGLMGAEAVGSDDLPASARQEELGWRGRGGRPTRGDA